MNLIIDIPEDSYERVMNPDKFYRDIDGEKIRWAVYKGTPIPDNATNLDVLKIMFPDYIPKNFTWVLGGDGADWDKPKGYCGNWWNAPYQKGGKE